MAEILSIRRRLLFLTFVCSLMMSLKITSAVSNHLSKHREISSLFLPGFSPLSRQDAITLLSVSRSKVYVSINSFVMVKGDCVKIFFK